MSKALTQRAACWADRQRSSGGDSFAAENSQSSCWTVPACQHLLLLAMNSDVSCYVCLVSLQTRLRWQLQPTQQMPLPPWMWTVQTSQQQGLARRQRLLLLRLKALGKLGLQRWMPLMLTLQQLTLVRAAQAQLAGGARLLAQQRARLWRRRLRLGRAVLLGSRQPAQRRRL